MEYPPCTCHPYYRKCTCFTIFRTCFTIFLWTFCILTSLDPLPNSFQRKSFRFWCQAYFQKHEFVQRLCYGWKHHNFGRVSFGSGWFQLTMVLYKNDMVAQGSDGQILITIVIIEQLPKAQEYLAWFGAKKSFHLKDSETPGHQNRFHHPENTPNFKEKRLEVLRCLNAGTGQMRLHQNWLLCLRKKNGWSFLFETHLFLPKS